MPPAASGWAGTPSGWQTPPSASPTSPAPAWQEVQGRSAPGVASAPTAGWAVGPAPAAPMGPISRPAAGGWDQGRMMRPAGFTSGRIAIIGLAVSAVLSGVLVVLGLPMLEADTWVEGVDGARIVSISDLAGLVELVIAVAYLAWSYQVTAGIPWLTGRMPSIGKVASVGWWFVPLANAVMPAVILNGLSRALAIPGRPRPAWLIPVWWVAYLLAQLLGVGWQVTLVELDARPSAVAEDFARATNLFLAGEALSIVAAVACIAMILRIGRDAAIRQRAAVGALPWPPPPDVR